MMNSLSYNYRKMRNADIPNVKAFLSRHKREIPHATNSGWFEWYHFNNPEGCQLYLCLNRSEIIAMSAFIQSRLLIDNTVYSAAFSTNTMVDKRHRRRGIGKQLHLIRLNNYDFALSSGQSQANANLYKKMGWNAYSAYYDILLTRKFKLSYLRKKYLKRIFSWSLWSLKSGMTENNYRVELSNHISNSFDPWPQSRFPQGVVGTIRNFEYIKWRYHDHPYFTYQFAEVFMNDKIIGLAVLRDSGSAKILVDLICEHKHIVHLLLALGLNVKTNALVGKFSGQYLKTQFKKAYWFTRPDGTFLVGNSKHPNVNLLTKEMSWSLFGGDSDKDR